MRVTFCSLFALLLSAPLQVVLGDGDAQIDSNSGSGDRGKVPKGFVTRKGTNFSLDNKNFVSSLELYLCHCDTDLCRRS